MSSIVLMAGSQPSEGHLNPANTGSQCTHWNLLVITMILPSSSSGRAVRTGVIAAGLRVTSHGERLGKVPCA